ncbi:SDR family NAD(P)-dependent oxidoreductase, partial [Micromonospora sp. NPDC048894]|uniref:SDR family NAD(P)-dependent oxidoreductase n=1 Tax=Micromonospora sp. NPDC048894 TaxID=3155493 RepID=UPI00340FF769
TTPTPTGHQTLTIHTRTTTTWTTHATATLSPEPAPDSTPAAPGVWPPPGAQPVDLSGLYARLTDHGYAYGPTFRNLRALWRHGDELYAEVSLPDGTEIDGHVVHPALLDAALHALIATPADLDGPLRVPFSWGGVRATGRSTAALRVRLTRLSEHAVRLVATDLDDAEVITVEELTTRPLAVDQLAAPSAPVTPLRVEWVPQEADPAAGSTAVHVVGVDPLKLADALRSAGRDVAVHADLDALAAAIDAGTAVAADTLVTCVTDGGPGPAIDRAAARPCDEVVALAHEVAERALGLAQRWIGEPAFGDHRLVTVTRGAVATRTGPEIQDLPASTVWGLIRSARAEFPDRFALLDLPGPADATLSSALAGPEPEAAVRDDTTLVPRLVPVADSAAVLRPPTGGGNWRLDVTSRGTLANLALVPSPAGDRPLAAGEVRVSMRAAGLNFRDVMIALGLYPGDDAQIGGEGAGVVVEVGSEVTGLAVGDRVMGLFPEGCAGPVAVSDHRHLVRTPARLSDVEAAVLPIVYLTAMYGLTDLADLRAGQRLLLHTATGGVGMAALHYARHLGATVHTTASAPKQATLAALGVPATHIHDSRTTAYGERIRETDPAGVDVVLNTLTHAHVDTSLALLAEGGTFLEIGKTDIRDPHTVTTTHPHLTYQPYDLLDAGPTRIHQLLTTLTHLLTTDALPALPVTGWHVTNAPDALRHLSQARHTGKIALVVPAPQPARGTILITGATGALATHTARHLATTHPHHHLLLTTRGNPDTLTPLTTELHTHGTTTHTAQIDLTQPHQLHQLLTTIPTTHPLTTVIHTAGTLHDTPLTTQTPHTLHTTLTAKIDTTHTLHTALQHHPDV